MIDPIADFLTRLRNAQMAGHEEVALPYSRIKEDIAQVMRKNKFLGAVAVDRETGKFPQLVVGLPKMKLSLRRISKSGHRAYAGSSDIRKSLNGLGIVIVSTSQGVMTGYEARSRNIGGEVLCEVS